MHTLHNQKPKQTKNKKKELLSELEECKETYVCGNLCPVNGFEK